MTTARLSHERPLAVAMLAATIVRTPFCGEQQDCATCYNGSGKVSSQHLLSARPSPSLPFLYCFPSSRPLSLLHFVSQQGNGVGRGRADSGPAVSSGFLLCCKTCNSFILCKKWWNASMRRHPTTLVVVMRGTARGPGAQAHNRSCWNERL